MFGAKKNSNIKSVYLIRSEGFYCADFVFFYHERHEKHEEDMVSIYFLSTDDADDTDFIWIIPRKNDILLELVKISGEWRVASGERRVASGEWRVAKS
ncbi:hypothetical protein L21SP3_00064 [Sedimentisphaera cyanobacteriorum]|uniref:Uncharacterized protein n=1 Tax=Sedimentisphaera cyanobacteriorum TaxID=1940790 RepID=A0A1Q2HLE8_9BACT|nr:hypothetical protein L21SP3_00064 [Sedimentisphaera cyanobacteriorum]